MDIGAVLIQLKPNALTHVDAWQAELNARKDEAIETLKAEGVRVESWFYLELEGNNYLLAYTRAEILKKHMQWHVIAISQSTKYISNLNVIG